MQILLQLHPLTYCLHQLTFATNFKLAALHFDTDLKRRPATLVFMIMRDHYLNVTGKVKT